MVSAIQPKRIPTPDKLARGFGIICLALNAFSIAAASEPLRSVHDLPSQGASRPTPISAMPIQGNVYLLSGAGSNVTLQLGSQGALLVDSGSKSAAKSLIAKIKRLAGTRIIRYVIDTQADDNHVGGNEALRQAGSTIFGGNVVMDDPRGQQGATVIAHENVQIAMATPTDGSPARSETLWPTETFSGSGYDLFFNEEGIQLIHVPAAHTDGDVMVFFRRSDVLVTGDVFVTTTYPVIDILHGGSIDGIIDALNQIIDITIPRENQEGGTIVVPGHGRLCDEADVVEYRDMVTIIRDRIRSLIDRGMSLQQVLAAKPTSDYDGRFGIENDSATTEKFVESVFRSLRKTN